MIPLPLFLYSFLAGIPWLGKSFIGKNREVKAGASLFVYVPLICFLDFFCRLCVVAGCAVGVFFLLLAFDVIKFNDKAVNQADSIDGMLRRTWNLDEADFRDTIAKASVDQLIENWSEFEDREDENYILHLNKLQNVMSVADKIVGSSTPRQSQFGLSKRLLLRSEKWLLHNSLEQPTTDVGQLLENDLVQAKLLGNENPNSEIDSSIELAELVVGIQDHLDSQAKSGLADTLIADLDVEKLRLDDRVVAKNAFKIAAIVDSSDSNGKLANLLLSWYSQSKNSAVKEIVASYRSASDDQVVVADINEISESDLGSVKEQLQNKFASLVSETTSKTEDLEEIASIGLDLVSIGSHEIVDDYSKRMNAVDLSNVPDELAKKLQLMSARSQAVGLDFEPDSLFDANGQNATFRPASKQVVLFSSSSRSAQSKQKLLSILDSIGNAFLGESVGLTIVFFHGADAETAISDFDRFDRGHKYLNVYYVPDQSDSAKRMMEQFGIWDCPYVLYLKDGKVALVAPVNAALVKSVFESR